MPPAFALTRMPIVDRRDRLVGYRLRVSQGGTSALLDRLAGDPPDARLFVDVQPGELRQACGPALSRSRVVLCPVGDASDPAGSTSQLDAMRARGVRLALTDVNPRSDWLGRLSSAEYAGVNPDCVPAGHLTRYVDALHRRHARVIATAVRSLSARQAAQAAGCDLIEGDWFVRDPQPGGDRVDPAYASVLRALGLAQAEAPLAELEQALRADPALAFRLMRYANSAALGLQTRVRTLREALTIIGYRPLARWLGLSLVTASVDTGANSVMSNTATLRGRLMEVLSPQLAAPIDSGDAFFTGLLSVLPAMMELTPERLVVALKPSPAIALALIGRIGPLGRLLRLVECCEDPDPAELSALCAELGLAPAAVAEAQLRALPWAERTARTT
ncbi:MAG TPA: HDOD domain-containing protein [Burkholderiaceae bacterium]|nr:HDOD domain-containing protein [Burkholderiaceae bacterium]